MDKNTFESFNNAKKNKDLCKMKEIYDNNSCDLKVKFEYSKLLILKGRKEEGKKLLFELLDTSAKNYAMLELGKLEKTVGNIEKARDYFANLLDTSSKSYAMLELGRLEREEGIEGAP